MDLNMPGLKGEDVLQELRSQFKTRMTPVIFLTGMNSKEDVIHGLSLGADDYLCKPFDVEELVARIDSSLRRCLVNLDANPLTRLPGNHAINKEILRRLDLKRPFSVLYGDLNEFKAYNDHYGFLSGNTVIEKTGQIFEQMAGEKATLVGHLGGDDFIIVTDRTDVEVLCKNILRTFDEQLQSFYTPEDFEAGSVLVKDRKDRPGRHR
jgi:PleD family two-component response regulator